jgi:hypothetical protein
MLALYTFFILALSSSVVAAPSGRALRAPRVVPPPTQPYLKWELLINNVDGDLTAGHWGRIVRAPWAENTPLEDRPRVTWHYAHQCDDFIRFGGRHNVQNVTRVLREIVYKKKPWSLYHVKRTSKKNSGRLETVYPNVPVEKWKTFLHNTQWGREPGIVGKGVSNGIMI